MGTGCDMKKQTPTRSGDQMSEHKKISKSERHSADVVRPLLPTDAEAKAAARKFAGSNYLKNHAPLNWDNRFMAFMAAVRWMREKIQAQHILPRL